MSRAGLSPLISPAATAGAPFILATPHHTMAWASGEGEPTAADYEAIIAQYDVALASIEQAKQQCDSQIKALDAQKQHLMDEREAMVKESKGIK